MSQVVATNPSRQPAARIMRASCGAWRLVASLWRLGSMMISDRSRLAALVIRVAARFAFRVDMGGWDEVGPPVGS